MTPVLRYRNPGAAARWLCEAFGFREHDRTQDTDQHIKYILLELGQSFVLVRPVSSSVFDDLMVEPSAVGGSNTHVLYLTIPDTETHSAQAQTAGAKIELEPQDDGLGGRFYTCRDPEGHLWSFGTKSYAPLRPPVVVPAKRESAPAPPLPAAKGGPSKRGRLGRAVATLAVLATLATGWVLYQTYGNDAFEVGRAMTTGAVATGGSAAAAPEPAPKLAAGEVAPDAAALDDERARRLAAEAALGEATAKVADEQGRRQRAEEATAAVTQKLSEASAAAAEARQAAQRVDSERTRERREAHEAIAAAERRLAEQTAEATRGREAVTASLAAAQQSLAAQSAAREQAQRELETVKAEAARERATQAAAAISASAEAAANGEQVAELERERATTHAELEAAYTTLKAIRGELESLRKPQHQAVAAEPRPTARVATAVTEAAAPAAAALAAPPPPPPARPSSPCAQAIQGKVPLAPNGSRTWPEASLARLCHGAETSLEPARCYDELMRGKISWGTGKTWTAGNALILCGGTRNARQTLDCFADNIAANDSWASAISACKLAKP